MFIRIYIRPTYVTNTNMRHVFERTIFYLSRLQVNFIQINSDQCQNQAT